VEEATMPNKASDLERELEGLMQRFLSSIGGMQASLRNINDNLDLLLSPPPDEEYSGESEALATTEASPLEA
jgi:hypothetical protein